MATNRKVIQPTSLPTPSAPYSLAIRTGDLIVTAGIVSTDKEGRTAGSDIRTQTRNVLETIKTILVSEGTSLANVIKTTVYLTDFANYQGMNEVYREYFPSEPPARATVGAKLVRDDWLVEIEVLATI
jgi:2-iminobutanoate/2-iminopropanoate deaminase